MTTTGRGAWQTVGSLAANNTAYMDDTVTATQTCIDRVKATDQYGSTVSNPEAVITAPMR